MEVSVYFFMLQVVFFFISFAGSSCVQVRGTSKHQGRSFLQERASLFFPSLRGTVGQY